MNEIKENSISFNDFSRNMILNSLKDKLNIRKLSLEKKIMEIESFNLNNWEKDFLEKFEKLIFSSKFQEKMKFILMEKVGRSIELSIKLIYKYVIKPDELSKEILNEIKLIDPNDKDNYYLNLSKIIINEGLIELLNVFSQNLKEKSDNTLTIKALNLLPLTMFIINSVMGLLFFTDSFDIEDRKSVV